MPNVTVILCGKKPDQTEIKALHQALATVVEKDLGAVKKLVSIRILYDEPGTWSVGGLLVDESTESSGAFVEIQIADSNVGEERMAAAMDSIHTILTETLGKNLLPPYVVFSRVPVDAWGFKGRSIKKIMSEISA